MYVIPTICKECGTKGEVEEPDASDPKTIVCDECKGIPADTVWEQCESSNLARYGYSAFADAIIVEFKPNTHVWLYAGSEASDLFEGMKQAPSVGKYFFANIRNNGQLIATQLYPRKGQAMYGKR